MPLHLQDKNVAHTPNGSLKFEGELYDFPVSFFLIADQPGAFGSAAASAPIPRDLDRASRQRKVHRGRRPVRRIRRRYSCGGMAKAVNESSYFKLLTAFAKAKPLKVGNAKHQ